jgi:hypothetical protein
MTRKKVIKNRPHPVARPSEKLNPFASAYAARLVAQVDQELRGSRQLSRPTKKPRAR